MKQYKDPNDVGRGLYDKFVVVRTDGLSEPGQLHEGCAYFPLDLRHDPHAIPAIRAYAYSVKDDNPTLARDLYMLLAVESRNCSRCGSGRTECWRPLRGSFPHQPALRSDNYTVHCRSCGHCEYDVP